MICHSPTVGFDAHWSAASWYEITMVCRLIFLLLHNLFGDHNSFPTIFNFLFAVLYPPGRFRKTLFVILRFDLLRQPAVVRKILNAKNPEKYDPSCLLPDVQCCVKKCNILSRKGYSRKPRFMHVSGMLHAIQ